MLPPPPALANPSSPPCRSRPPGDPAFIGKILDVHDRRARLLGLDAPVKQEHSGPDGGPIPLGAAQPLNEDDCDAILDRHFQRMKEEEARAGTPPTTAAPNPS